MLSASTKFWYAASVVRSTLTLASTRLPEQAPDSLRMAVAFDTQKATARWCPAEVVSTVVHVYLGGVHARFTWRAVLRDAFDGRLDRVYPCGALREAIAHLPADAPTFSTLPATLGRAASAACSAALRGLRRGAPRSAVDAAFGKPTSGGPQCVAWSWAPYGRSVDGARICFAGGRARLVQTALHG